MACVSLYIRCFNVDFDLFHDWTCLLAAAAAFYVAQSVCCVWRGGMAYPLLFSSVKSIPPHLFCCESYFRTLLRSYFRTFHCSRLKTSQTPLHNRNPPSAMASTSITSPRVNAALLPRFANAASKTVALPARITSVRRHTLASPLCRVLTA